MGENATVSLIRFHSCYLNVMQTACRYIEEGNKHLSVWIVVMNTNIHFRMTDGCDCNICSNVFINYMHDLYK